jgi:hypothetical protein
LPINLHHLTLSCREEWGTKQNLLYYWLKQRQEKKTKKNLPIKAILTTLLYEEKQQTNIIKNWAGIEGIFPPLVKGGDVI